MSKIRDITGQKFNRLTVLGFSHINKHNYYWKCQCECGKESIVNAGDLKNGKIKSCGCYLKEKRLEFENLTGKKYNKLLVLEYSYKKHKQHYWKCLCDCGNIKIIGGGSLKTNGSKSCGCLDAETKLKRWSGENHPKWRGGITETKKGYPPKLWTEKLKESIRNRDGRKCQYPNCEYSDSTKGNKRLDVHHINGNKSNCESYNLISLCCSPHSHVEANPKGYLDYFYQITTRYEI